MLGLILAPLGQETPGQYPNEINYTGAMTGGPYLCPDDPQFNTRGEIGWYYDTQLGGLHGEGIPTDDELATVYGYTPFMSGQVNAKEAWFPGPWIPPSNYSAAGAYGPQPTPKNLSGASSDGSTPTWLVLLVFVGLGAAAWWGYKEFKKPVRA